MFFILNMFFIVSKILSFLVSPFTWVFFLLLASWFVKSAKTSRQLLITAIFALYFFSNSFIVDEYSRAWEVKVDPNAKKRTYEYGIVLGGIISGYVPSNEQIVFNRGVDRIMQGIELYKQGIIKKIVFTGGSGSLVERNMIEANYIKQFLLKMGIPENDIIIENKSRNTYENAVFVKNIIGVDSSRTDLLITSGYHMKRSIACFKKQGFIIQPYPSDLISGPRKYVFDHLFIPNFRSFEIWYVLIHEWIGYFAYWINGYI